MSSLNPFLLFGVDNHSKVSDLKKSFKNLSLACHPDKGGSKEEMETVYNSYIWVKKQLENENHERTFEMEEENFKKFLEDQKNVKIPTMFEIMTDGFNKKFNEEFERCQNKSQMTYSKTYQEEDFKDENEGVLIKYETPISFDEVGCSEKFYNLNDKVSDFTGGIGYDLKKAYVKEKINVVYEDIPLEERLERLKKERELL